MKIFGDILNRAVVRAKKHKTTKLQVVDTVNEFWQQVKNENQQAKLFDASALMSSFPQSCSLVKYFERGVQFNNLAPFSQTKWIEVVDSELPHNLAVSLTYTERDNLAVKQAEYCGIKEPFKWICYARSFLKRQYQLTLPLKWEWVEYINADGNSVGSMLQPIVLPEYINRMLEPELNNLEFIHDHLCAFIANLGLYAVDLINNNQVTVTAHTAPQFSYGVIELKEKAYLSGRNWTQ